MPDRWHWTMGQGRYLAVLALAVLVLIRWFDPSFVELSREKVFDLYQELHPRQPATDDVVVVEIDELSLKDIGQWPWARHRLASLIATIAPAGPRAIGLDVIFSEADRQSPENAIREWVFLDEAQSAELESWIAAWSTNDELLGESTAFGIPVVISALGINPKFDIIGPADPPSGGSAPSFLGEVLDKFITIQPLPAGIDGSAALRGIANIVPSDDDGIVRKGNLLFWVDEGVRLSLALEMLRVGLRASGPKLVGNDKELREISFPSAGRVLPVSPKGQIRPYFALHKRGITAAGKVTRSVMAANIMKGSGVHDFRDRWVLIGLTDPTLAPEWPTPLGVRMSGTAIQAQILENLIEESWLVRPDWSIAVETGLAVALALLIMLYAPRSRMHKAAVLALGLALVCVAGGFCLFVAFRLLADGTLPAAATLVTFAIMSSAGYAIATRDRRRMEFELAEARRVQQSMLPDLERIEGMPSGIELAASLEPAREVGGDFYGVVPLDDRRLLFLVGDVSGKGIDAALFMAVGKTLMESLALRQPDLDPGALLTSSQAEIARANSANMFVAMAACTVDTQSGEMKWAVAGHAPPLIVSGGVVRVLAEAKVGIPLCLDPEEVYETGLIILQPGDSVLLATDGVFDVFDQSEGNSIGNFIEMLLSAPSLAGAGALHAFVRDRMASWPTIRSSDDQTLLAFTFEGLHVAASGGVKK